MFISTYQKNKQWYSLEQKTFQPSIGCLIIHYIFQTFFQTYICSTIVCTILAEIENKELESGCAWLFIKWAMRIYRNYACIYHKTIKQRKENTYTFFRSFRRMLQFSCLYSKLLTQQAEYNIETLTIIFLIHGYCNCKINISQNYIKPHL